ncbi:MAG: ammonium transporter [Candidatus Calescibacterium sp.]|nr:ammonium transporter [Candidatus Calescibacterium sp.]MCX7733779.1 ammonium transporter [bacterium]MDW8087949.1 ammonium transporter [Candidatus Calescibacterium sp.]
MEEQVSQINQGDTAWIIVATALVGMMTIPALALFYGGLTRTKSILNTIMMNISAYFLVSVAWVMYGYTLSFNESFGGIIGIPSKLLMNTVDVKAVSGSIPEFTFSTFQLTFAAITVALISGAVVERMKFSAWVIFSILWLTFVYCPVAHWVWGGGFLMKMGALDFAGGTVVHINAGISAVVLSLFLGKRKEGGVLPSNIPLVVIGAGLLLIGWFGFNGGSALSSGGLAASAVLVTNTAASFAAITWMFIEKIHRGKPTTIGAASGLVAGLVGITPASGFVDVIGALFIGALSSAFSYIFVVVIKSKLPWDDALDVFGIHGVSGIVGSILTGVFANPSINEAGTGLLYGNPNQLWIQIISSLIVIAYSFVVTAIIALIIKATVGLRTEEESEIMGLNESEHGEKAFN